MQYISRNDKMRFFLVLAFICLAKISVCQNTTSSSSLAGGESKQEAASLPSTEASDNTITSLPVGETVNTTVMENPHGNNVTDLNSINQTMTTISVETNKNTPNNIVTSTEPVKIVTATVEVVTTTSVNGATSKNSIVSTTVNNEENVSTTVGKSVRILLLLQSCLVIN